MSDSMFTRIDTVFLEVSNLEKAISWYSDHLGLHPRWHNADGGYAALGVSETPLTLIQSENVKPAEYTPFNFYTSDVEGTHRKLKEKGVMVYDIEDYGDVKAFDFKDPDGNKLGVCHFKE